MKTAVLIFSILFLLSNKAVSQNKTYEFAHRQILKDSSWQLSKHIKGRKLIYVDQLGKRVVVQVLEAKLKKNRLRLEAATPDNEDGYGRQEVERQMKAENQNGAKVLAGVNADFFNMKNGTPLGPVIKEGRIIKQRFNGTNAYVGVLKSGRVHIGDSSDFKEHKQIFQEALGARPLLIVDKKLIPQDSSSLSTVHHPRTALGLKAHGKKVLLLVVDGRRPGYSNGISLTDLSKILLWMGATDAVNLDGGGSTTLVSIKADQTHYQTLNRPSDATPRTVANSWILVKPK